MFTCDMKSRIPLGIQQKIQISRNTTLLLIEVVDIRFVFWASLKYSTCLIQTIVSRVYHATEICHGVGEKIVTEGTENEKESPITNPYGYVVKTKSK